MSALTFRLCPGRFLPGGGARLPLYRCRFLCRRLGGLELTGLGLAARLFIFLVGIWRRFAAICPPTLKVFGRRH